MYQFTDQLKQLVFGVLTTIVNDTANNVADNMSEEIAANIKARFSRPLLIKAQKIIEMALREQ